MLSLNLINWEKVFENMNINICSLNFEKKTFVASSAVAAGSHIFLFVSQIYRKIECMPQNY